MNGSQIPNPYAVTSQWPKLIGVKPENLAVTLNAATFIPQGTSNDIQRCR